nr:TonB-dependent receptor [Bacteroidota bacterium]
MKLYKYFLFFFLIPAFLHAQDTLPVNKDSVKRLTEIIVETKKDNEFGITRLKQVEGTAIYAGKKNDVIIMSDVNGNTAANNARQVFSKVA